MEESSKARQLIAEHEARAGERTAWDTRWQRVQEWFTPHRAHVMDRQDPPGNVYRSRIHDTKGISSANVLAQGHMSYITPMNEQWFAFATSVRESGSEQHKSWFKECTEVAIRMLSQSNFYTVINSVFRDRSTLGTGCLFLNKGKSKPLNFQYVEIGTYTVAEDEDGVVNTLSRELEYTVMQAADKFGKDQLGAKLRSVYEQAMAGDSRELTSKYRFIHVVQPNREHDPGKLDSRAYLSHYICCTDEQVVEEGGFYEFPFLVTRYERWGNHPWGFSPAYNAMPNVLSANFMKKILKLLGETAALPRVLELADQKHNVDMRAGGRTVVSEKAAAMGFPREWGTGGSFQAGQFLIEQEHEQIEMFFHVPLFQMFAQLQKQMTATEVAARESEKLLMFAPSFVQFVSDMEPLMQRMFSLLLREDYFPPAPEGLARETGEEGLVALDTPVIEYQSKLALAIKQLETMGLDRVMQRAAMIAQYDPGVLDNFDFDGMVRDMARNEGFPERWLVKLEEMEQLREQRAQAQQQAEQMAQMGQAAEAVGKAGIDPAQAIQAML
ncbi:Bacteriophage head to tail connecting protein [Rubritalea squalenifaciens DSM 18772]|uniref:Bacteriophage head to tail connecting protein n=1 Tax=Rubritalea squalenifaciens DSM 18772 TaxID=1123071 RepID=A0A1M6CGT6_9BACT|nr:portal protein [Rubritalea squalenifaciens]SHI59898.1 Bacteriophage head to tail connecting protein [Rubritalea squalenifaciens DSM 18772]